jgi:hypothetical protein
MRSDLGCRLLRKLAAGSRRRQGQAPRVVWPGQGGVGAIATQGRAALTGASAVEWWLSPVALGSDSAASGCWPQTLAGQMHATMLGAGAVFRAAGALAELRAPTRSSFVYQPRSPIQMWGEDDQSRVSEHHSQPSCPASKRPRSGLTCIVA